MNYETNSDECLFTDTSETVCQTCHASWGREFLTERPVLTALAAATAESLQLCLTLCDPIDAAHQAPPSLGFSRQEYWNGLPFPSPMHGSEKSK